MFKRFVAALLASVGVVAVTLSVSSGAARAAVSDTLYAGAQQTFSDSVMFANFGVGKPVLAGDDTRSGATMLVRDGSGNGVGIGWAVDPGLNGDSEPHLFVAWWKDNAGQCYNTDCPGYVPYAGATLAVGAKFTAGTPQRFGIQHSGSEWWLWAGTTAGVGSYIGFFRDSNWTTAWPTFSKVQLYGEVTSTALRPTSEMGNGYCADNVNSLTIANVTFSTSSTVNLATFVSYPRAYSASRLSARTFRYGGAGFCG